MLSDNKSLEDASRHLNTPKTPKQSPTFICAQSPSSRGSARKKKKNYSGRRRTQKDQDKPWFAKARFKESDTEYFSHESAQRETVTKPKARLLLVPRTKYPVSPLHCGCFTDVFYPQAASFDTSILPILSKRKSACIHPLYLDFDQ